MRLAAVALGMVAFGAAFALRASANVWLVTGAAAAVGAALALASDAAGIGRSLRPSGRAVAVGLVVGLGMAAATYLVYPLEAWAGPDLSSSVDALYAELRQPPGPLRALPVLVLVVAAEELVWRGALVDALEARGWSRRAVIAAALAYPLPHLLSGSWLLPAIALGCGLVWTAERVLTGSLLATFLTHLVWDLLVFVALPLDHVF